MLNASVGVQRVLGRVRRTPEHPRSAGEPRQERGRAAARRVRHGIQAIVAASQLVPLRDTQPAVELSAVEDPSRRSLIARLGPDRAVAFALAGILLGASALSVSAGGPVPATEASTGDAAALHLVAGGRTGGTGGTLPNVPRLAETDRTGSVEFGQPDQRTAPRASFAPLDLRAATVAASEPATAGDTVTGGDPATNTDPATSSDAATNKANPRPPTPRRAATRPAPVTRRPTAAWRPGVNRRPTRTTWARPATQARSRPRSRRSASKDRSSTTGRWSSRSPLTRTSPTEANW